jgi:hypothetical protein
VGLVFVIVHSPQTAIKRTTMSWFQRALRAAAPAPPAPPAAPAKTQAEVDKELREQDEKCVHENAAARSRVVEDARQPFNVLFVGDQGCGKSALENEIVSAVRKARWRGCVSHSGAAHVTKTITRWPLVHARAMRACVEDFWGWSAELAYVDQVLAAAKGHLRPNASFEKFPVPGDALYNPNPTYAQEAHCIVVCLRYGDHKSGPVLETIAALVDMLREHFPVPILVAITQCDKCSDFDADKELRGFTKSAGLAKARLEARDALGQRIDLEDIPRKHRSRTRLGYHRRVA